MMNEPAVGVLFGRWTIIAEGPRRNKLKQWFCRCQCGTERLVLGTNLRRGRSSGCEMCGPLRTGIAALKHGQSESAEYKVWKGMKRRCYSAKAAQYADYGGRGIGVCDRWLSSFENFISDMGPRPSAEHSIDRFPDNDGNYEPGNCRWATREEQMSNRSCNLLFTLNGETRTLAQWAKHLDISWGTLYARIFRHGWTVERALRRSQVDAMFERLMEMPEGLKQ